MSLPPPAGNLSVEQIIVTPPGPPGSVKPCLTGVSFQLAAGEALGIIGPSAAGKTSLARAMLGIWPVVSGVVRLDGADINQFDRDELGPYLGYLPQDIELFDGTIAENICRFSDPDADRIIEASKTACIHEMVLNLPEGYETNITSTSGALSAGQRQRVGLARALYGKPKLIILDEPNSNLDEQGERELLVALRQMKEAGSTVIVISHRTSILELTDKLLLMAGGRVVKFGARDEVLNAINTAKTNVAQLQ
jgi:ATP-binding cassette subfamily C protein EexD